jgi:NADPH-dependent 2,4-dienoyl-CoA reductase/sulfur reductase-like enzyme
MMSTGERLEHRCDGDLVWATGVAVTGPPVPGADYADCNATPTGFERLLPRLSEAVPGRRVVVIGAGLIGCETAATLAARHSVILLERAPAPLMRMPPMVASAASEGLAIAGVEVVGECLVEGIERDGEHLLVHTDSRVLVADIVLAATGVGRALPGDVGEGLGIATDACLAVLGEERTWACGDVAVFPHPRHGTLAIPHWDHAMASGRHVAEAITDHPSPYGREPYWFSDIGRVRIQVVGHEPAVSEWRRVDELLLGVDIRGRVACVVLVNQPARIREARGLVSQNAGLTKERSWV